MMTAIIHPLICVTKSYNVLAPHRAYIVCLRSCVCILNIIDCFLKASEKNVCVLAKMYTNYWPVFWTYTINLKEIDSNVLENIVIYLNTCIFLYALYNNILKVSFQLENHFPIFPNSIFTTDLRESVFAVRHSVVTCSYNL